MRLRREDTTDYITTEDSVEYKSAVKSVIRCQIQSLVSTYSNLLQVNVYSHHSLNLENFLIRSDIYSQKFLTENEHF